MKLGIPREAETLYHVYLMQHHIRVRDQIMWIRAQAALNTRVSLQHRGLLFAFSAHFASAPNIVSQIMFAHYLHHPTWPGLLNEGFRFQHDDKEPQKVKSRCFYLTIDCTQSASYPCVNPLRWPTKTFPRKSAFMSYLPYVHFFYVNLYLETVS